MVVLELVLSQGISFGIFIVGEVWFVELINEVVPSVELVWLVNFGFEVVMGVLCVAWGYIGCDKIVKFEGCYYGSVDVLFVKVGLGAITLGIFDFFGVLVSFIEYMLFVEFNNFDFVLELVEVYLDEIVGIILESVVGNMGMIVLECYFL